MQHFKICRWQIIAANGILCCVLVKELIKKQEKYKKDESKIQAVSASIYFIKY